MKLANGNYIRPTARFSWWLRHQRYWRYMMRELSSLFIGIFSIMMVWGLYRLSQGEAEFTQWLHGLWNNLAGLSWLMLLFAIYHSYTWFIVTPKALPLKISGKRVADIFIVAAHLLLWLICSVVVWIAFVYGGGA